jgi:hypothetical protein
MSETPFQKVMGLLSSLSRAELATVAFHAQSLSVGSAPRRGNPAGSRPPSKKGDKDKKGPAQPSPKYADVPEYVGFKKADKALKAALKESKKSLKELEASPGEHEMLLRAFHEARELWFRRKSELAPMASPPASSSKAFARSQSKTEIFPDPPAKPEGKGEAKKE